MFIAALLGAAFFGLLASGVVLFATQTLSTKVSIHSHSGFLVRSSATSSSNNSATTTTAHVQSGILDNEADNEADNDGAEDDDDGIADSLGVIFLLMLIPLLARNLSAALAERFKFSSSAHQQPLARPG